MRAFLVFPCGLLCGALSLATPTRAENQAPAAGEPGRYTMTPTEGGFLRLDTQAGSVSFSRSKTGYRFVAPALTKRPLSRPKFRG